MQRYLVIQTAFLGDTLLTLPLIQAIHTTFNNSLIDVVTLPANAEVFRLSPFINEVFTFDKRGNEKGFYGIYKLARKISRNNYTKVYVPHRSSRSSILAFLLGFPSVSFDKSALSFLYTERVRYNGAEHEVERNLRLLSKDVINWKEETYITYSTVDTKKIDLLFTNGSSVIALAPGSVWETKKYPLQYFIQVTRELSDLGFTIALLGSSKESEDAENIITSLQHKKIMNLTGTLSVAESVYFLSKCDALLSNDSAPTHMGVLAGIPVLTIYCSTVPEFGFFPYNRGSKFLSFNGLECKPCGIHGRRECPLGTFECAHKVQPKEVVSEVVSMVKKKANELSSSNKY